MCIARRKAEPKVPLKLARLRPNEPHNLVLGGHEMRIRCASGVLPTAVSHPRGFPFLGAAGCELDAASTADAGTTAFAATESSFRAGREHALRGARRKAAAPPQPLNRFRDAASGQLPFAAPALQVPSRTHLRRQPQPEGLGEAQRRRPDLPEHMDPANSTAECHQVAGVVTQHGAQAPNVRRPTERNQREPARSNNAAWSQATHKRSAGPANPSAQALRSMP